MRNLNMLTGTVLLAIFAGSPGIASAQPPQQPVDTSFNVNECISAFRPAADDQSRIQDFMTRRATATSRDLPLAVGIAAPTATTAVAIVASEKDGRGVLSLSPNSAIKGNANGKWNLEISAPFSKSEGQATLASLAGLSGDIVANVAYSRFHWDISPQAYGRILCEECQLAGIQDLLDCSRSGLKEAARKRFLSELKREAVEKTLSEEERQAREVRADLFADREEARLETRMYDALFGPLVARIWSLEASAGRKERTFFALDAEKETENRIGHSFSVVGGLVFQRTSVILPRWSSFTKLTGKRDYKENDKATLCKPITGSILEDCTSQPLGEAKEVESLILATEARLFFRGSALGEFALAPSAQYDFEKKVWGFEAPLFLVRNTDQAFTGGVKLAWRSDQRDLVAAIFISRALKVDAP